MEEKNLKAILFEAAQSGWALGHFNISNLEQLRAIINASRALKSPVLIGTSEGERKFIGLRQAVYLVRSFQEEAGLPIFLNADHSKSVEEAKAAVDAGYDSVHIDLSAKSFEENIAGTAEVVKYAKSKNSDISVEGELGYLRGESKIQKEIIKVSAEDYTKVNEAKEFVERTGVDRFAPVVGNIHGIAMEEPSLDIELIKNLKQALPGTALILHGGSGIPEEQIKAAIRAGISNIHINTEIRVAYANALKASIAENPEETTPYKLAAKAASAVEEVVKSKLLLFGSVNRT